MKYYVLDVESIGLAPPKPPASGVVQIAWTEICPETLSWVQIQQYMVNPEAPIHPGASAVHGWYSKDVQNSPKLEEVFKPVEPLVLICHNTAYDSKFVGRYIENLAGELCTLRLARHYVKDSVNHKLATLAAYFGIEAGKAHDAAGDVETTVQVLAKLVEISGRTLHQLVEANKPRNFLRMPFGKHKGMLMNDLPISYIKWFMEQDIDQDLRISLQQQLKVRQ